MRIGLIGYGKMGKTIESIIREEGKHEIGLIISEENLHEFTVENLQKIDVAIEFTQPNSAVSNIMKCFEANIPVVVGTTAWHEHLPKVKAYCEANNQTILPSSNFSIGVNIFFEINRKLAEIMYANPAYSASLTEIHHTEKKDAPSGTAVTLAHDLVDKLHLSGWELVNQVPAESTGKLPIVALREPDVPGTHSILYESDIDQIEIIHTAKSRRGFAFGAIRAAEFIFGKKGFFEMKDVLNFK
ncbi:MAG: 4-hydroxy-tetrahydrodipicolinate reductase [Chitinophagales bacterium]|nr:4-hydroxy-tetrahydrodipicolinate reductase [Chitinophagales bacterium]